MDTGSVYFKGFVTITVVTLVFVFVAVPLALRKVPRNTIYGFRTSKTLKSDSIWYEANAYFGRALIYASLASVVTIFLMYSFLRPEPDWFFKASLLALVVPSGIAAIAAWIHIRDMDDSAK